MTFCKIKSPGCDRGCDVMVVVEREDARAAPC